MKHGGTPGDRRDRRSRWSTPCTAAPSSRTAGSCISAIPPATSSRFEDGLTIYFAGDTALFGDMRLIGELYRPAIAFLPIGDRFTMGPEQRGAARVEMLGVQSGRADALRNVSRF